MGKTVARGLACFRGLVLLGGPLPLTPALSPGERENVPPLVGASELIPPAFLRCDEKPAARWDGLAMHSGCVLLLY
jgi:hypothetical protein